MEFLDLIFPKSCLGCGREGIYICSDCVAKVRIAKPICSYCERASIDGVTHIKCSKKFGLDGLMSVWEYEGVIRKAILALKYKYSTEVGKELSDTFVKFLISSHFLISNSSLLIPVPLYWYKENTRGFNQSVEIGKAVAIAIGWKFVPDLLVKKKSTISQVDLRGDQRRKNLRNVFTLNTKYKILDTNYIIFDDVMTTGSTLKEAAKVLKRVGVGKVLGLTIAR